MRTAAPLLLVPNTLDFGAEAGDIRDVLPDGVLRQAAALTHWLAEDARTTRAFLKRVAAVHPLARPLQELQIQELPRTKGVAHPGSGRRGADRPRSPDRASTTRPIPPGIDPLEALLQPALNGHALGLISEAGLPAVADPGADVVAAAHRLGIEVRALPGPSSLLLALAASGLHGQSFAFVGYLPQDTSARQARIRELEALARRLKQTQLMIETPYRNGALQAALLSTLAPSTRLSVSCGLTLAEGWSRTDTVSGWIARPQTLPDRVPAVFALLPQSA